MLRAALHVLLYKLVLLTAIYARGHTPHLYTGLVRSGEKVIESPRVDGRWDGASMPPAWRRMQTTGCRPRPPC